MKPHEEWLFKADHDLQSSEFLMTSDNPLYDIAIYHTQQCAEKALKAYLSYKEQEIDKIHNLIVLNNNCIMLDNSFIELKQDVIFLNPYDTAYRYPEGDLMPPKHDVQKAISLAEKILLFVKDKVI